MLEFEDDREKVRQVRPGFRPLLIGLHWPSLPWGDEELDVSAVSFAPGEDPIAPLVEDAADKIADTERAKQALRTIFSAAMEDISPSILPPEVVDAYKILQQEAGLDGEGPAGAPGADAEAFDPEQFYQAELDDEVSFGGLGIGGLLSPLRQLSFWKMKARAKDFGESGAGTLRLEDVGNNVHDLSIHRPINAWLIHILKPAKLCGRGINAEHTAQPAYA